MGNAITVSEQTWEQEVLKSALPVMVDFWAPWCGPCRMIAPVIDELALEYGGHVKICKLNSDENPEMGARYQVMGIPTLLFFKEGTLKDRVVGAASKTHLKAKLDAFIAP